MRRIQQYFHCLFQTTIQVIKCSPKCHMELTICYKGDRFLYGCTCGKIFGKHSPEERLVFDCFNDEAKKRYKIE